MKTLRCLVLVLCVGIFSAAAAESGEKAGGKPPPSPGDVAATEFFKVRDDKAAAPSPARFHQLLSAGFGFLETYPTHRKAPDVVAALGSFGMTMRQKGQ